MSTLSSGLMITGFVALGVGKLVGPGTNDHAIEATGRMFQAFGATTLLAGLGVALLSFAAA